MFTRPYISFFRHSLCQLIERSRLWLTWNVSAAGVGRYLVDEGDALAPLWHSCYANGHHTEVGVPYERPSLPYNPCLLVRHIEGSQVDLGAIEKKIDGDYSR